MLREIGTVIAYKENIALIHYQSKTSCDGCAQNNACGVSLLSQFSLANIDHQQNTFKIKCDMSLVEGQKVEIHIQEQSLVFSAFLLYIIPMVTLLISVLIGQHFVDNELLLTLFITITTFLSFKIIQLYCRKIEKDNAYQIKIRPLYSPNSD